MTVIHEVKSWPRFFDPILAGTRRHELRRNDRDYKVGDSLLMREFDPDTHLHTGRTAVATITSITSSGHPCAVSDEGLNPDFCILTIDVTPTTPPHPPVPVGRGQQVPLHT